MKSYMNTAIAEVAEGIANNKNNLFCQVPENSFNLLIRKNTANIFQRKHKSIYLVLQYRTVSHHNQLP